MIEDAGGPRLDRIVGHGLEKSMKIQAYRCTWDGDTRGWMQYHDHTDPLPDEWDDEPPDEVAALVLKIDADIEIDRLRASLAEALEVGSHLMSAASHERARRLLAVPNASNEGPAL